MVMAGEGGRFWEEDEIQAVDLSRLWRVLIEV